MFQDMLYTFSPTKKSLLASLSRELTVMIADRQVINSSGVVAKRHHGSTNFMVHRTDIFHVT